MDGVSNREYTFKFCAKPCRTRSNRSTVSRAAERAEASLSLPSTAFTSLSYMSAAGPLPLETDAPTIADDLPGPELIGGAPLSSRTRTASSSSRLERERESGDAGVRWGGVGSNERKQWYERVTLAY